MPASIIPVTERQSQTPTVTTGSAYASGNVIGGLLTFGPIVRRAGGSGILNTVTLRDKSGQAGTYDLFLFDQNPTNSTFTDKAAIAINTADLASVIGVLTIAAVKLGAASTMGVSTLNSSNLSFKLSSGSTMWGVLVTRGTPTYAGASDVSLDLIVVPD